VIVTVTVIQQAEYESVHFWCLLTQVNVD